MQQYGHYRSTLHKNRFIAAIIHRVKAITGGSLFKNLLLGLIAVGLLGALVIFLGYLWFASTLPSADDINNRDVAQSTKIFDRTGEHLLYEIAENEKRTIVPISSMPQTLINATITAEDRQFYNHHGINYLSIARSIYEDIKCGCKAQGASTLTQQMVRNVILTLDKTYTRKIKEVLLSYAVEDKFTKDQILELYLNQIGYGSTNYGVESASQAYFGKTVSQLTLAESATLAAMPKQPSRYLRDPELLKARRNWILTNMGELGYATSDEVAAALAQETPVVVKLSNITAPHFVLWVKEQLESEYTEREVETGGLKVITTLDYEKQMAAEAAIATGIDGKGEVYGFNNAGLLSIDPKTGQILAMVGSVDYNNDEIQGQVNVTQQPLQPGSSMKPIIYAAAWEKGYTPNSILWDVNTTFSTETGVYSPRNYDNGEHGYVTMRKALQGSLNIPAVKTMYLVGIDSAITFAERMGYTTLGDRSRFGLSLVLGGAEVTMADHLRAYGTFANNGLQQETTGILKVEDPKGVVLQEWKAEEHLGNQAISSNLAATVSNVLSDNNARAYIFGTGSALQLGGRPVAAKTGTTNDFNDAWTMGYTPSLATSVWVGNTDGTQMNKNAEAVFIAAPIWKEYMQKALEGTPVENFPTPTIDMTGKAMLDGNIPTTTYTIDSTSGKLATEYTPERYRETKTCGEYHTILTYVNKDDPRGEVPTDPKSDSYYQPWEDAVQAWITNHNASLKDGETEFITCKDIPTEYDDSHTADSAPSIRFRSPNNNQSLGRTFTTELESEVHGSFSRVDYAIDGAYIATGESMNGNTLTLPTWVTTGMHTLTATIYDSNENKGEDAVSISVSESSGNEAAFHITNPFPNQTIENTGATYMVIIEVPSASDITYLEVTAKNLWTGETTVIGNTTNPTAITTINWVMGSNAEYQLTARASKPDGTTVEANPALVTVTTPVSTSIPAIQ
ncbi:MAG: PBP1A family penicillin-binding protein [Patescibacteria group bacterium]|jgi:1A family penicillin-binding protein